MHPAIRISLLLLFNTRAVHTCLELLTGP